MGLATLFAEWLWNHYNIIFEHDAKPMLVATRSIISESVTNLMVLQQVESKQLLKHLTGDMFKNDESETNDFGNNIFGICVNWLVSATLVSNLM